MKWQAEESQHKTEMMKILTKGKVQFNSKQTQTLLEASLCAMLEARKVREPWGFDCGCQSCGSLMPLEGGLCCNEASYLPLREFCSNPSLRCLFYERNGWELPEKLS
jgi:hypothetical protein